MTRIPPILALVFSVSLTALVHAGDWSQFRGPGGAGTGEATGLPAEWSAEKNVVWRTEMPGLGSSSPIVVKDRVYLTCYTGYGLDADQPGDMNALVRHVICVERASGKIAWTKAFPARMPESTYRRGNNSWHGYSTSTPTSDGQHLYVFFGKSGVYCLSLEDGSETWRADVGDDTDGWGSGASPVLFGDLVIVNASVESQSLVALDKGSGKEVWRVGGIKGAWNTPTLASVNGATELVICVPQQIQAYDPQTGKLLWTCEGIPDRGYICPSVVAQDGVVYAIGGRRNTAIAVRAGGRGDVTESHELWRTAKGSNVSSPVVHDGYVYWVHEKNGIANCLNAETGEVVYQERLSPRPGFVYSSMLVADGKLFCVSQHNGVYVMAAKPEFELLAHNVFADDDSRVNASPIVHQGKLLMRSDRYLYCLGSAAD